MMTMQSVALFAHIVGVLTLFVALAVEWMSVELLRTGDPAGPSSLATSLLRRLGRLGGVALLLILVSGMYMAGTFGVQGSAWVRVSFGSMVLMGALGGPALRPLRRSVGANAAGETLQRLASNTFLRVSLRMRIGVGLAIVYLMVAKPDLLASLAIVAVGLIAGAGAGLIGAQPAAVPAFVNQDRKPAARATGAR